MVYFCDGAIPQAALKDAQFNRLQEVRKRYETQGLLSTYTTVEQLREIVQLHLTSLVTQLLLKYRAAGQPIPATGTVAAPSPDIRVLVKPGFIAQGAYTREILFVEVQNHSPNDFFFSGIQLELSDGMNMLPPRDTVTGEFVTSRKLESGNSYTLHLDPRALLASAKGQKFISAVAIDKIDRRYKSAPGTLENVIRVMTATK